MCFSASAPQAQTNPAPYPLAQSGQAVTETTTKADPNAAQPVTTPQPAPAPLRDVQTGVTFSPVG